jgi:hypothetical protein
MIDSSLMLLRPKHECVFTVSQLAAASCLSPYSLFEVFTDYINTLDLDKEGLIHMENSRYVP